MKKVLKFIWGLLKNNLVLKIMALLFAVVLWSYVLAETNPVRERTLPDIRVTYEGLEQLEDNGLAISKSLSELVQTVNVRYEVNQSDLKFLGTSPITATVNLSEISSEGERELKIDATGPYCRVIEVSPSTVKLNIDNYVPKQLPVDLEVTGNVPVGFYASPPVADDTVTISGAAVDVEKASRAVCRIDITGLTEWNKKSMEVTILDSEGNPLDPGLFDQSLPSVIVDMSILPKKTVPVDVAGSIVGQDSLAPGYEIAGDIVCDPATVEIVGEASALRGVSAISLVPYSVSGASGDVVVLLEYAPPEGVTVLGEPKAQVTITIREKTRTETFNGVGIDMRNLGGGLSAKLGQSEVDVTVLAGISKMSKLRASDVAPYVDLNGLGVGTHTVNILFEIPEGFAPENFSASVATVTVTISRG